jgi:hypothetical protein
MQIWDCVLFFLSVSTFLFTCTSRTMFAGPWRDSIYKYVQKFYPLLHLNRLYAKIIVVDQGCIKYFHFWNTMPTKIFSACKHWESYVYSWSLNKIQCILRTISLDLKHFISTWLQNKYSLYFNLTTNIYILKNDESEHCMGTVCSLTF